MSVLITMRVPGDTDQFRRFVQDEDQLREISERAKAAGALHHRFGVGDGFVLVVDEWETAEAFQQFIAGLGDVFRDAGAQGPPEVTISEAITTADQF
jgi:hypothetical protein